MRFDQDAAGHTHTTDWLFLFLCAIHDSDCRIGRVGNQAAFIGMNRLEHAFPGKGVAVNQVEGASIERKATGVVDPKCPEHVLRASGPERYLLRFDPGLENGDQGRLVLTDGDLLLELVLEIVAETLGFGLGLLAFGVASEPKRAKHFPCSG